MANKKPNKPKEKHISLMISEDLYDWLSEKMGTYGSRSQVIRTILRQVHEHESVKPRKKTG